MLRFSSFNSVWSISGRSVKVFVWSPGMVAATIYLFGPENLGGLGDIRKKIEDSVCISGRAYNEVAREVRMQYLLCDFLTLRGTFSIASGRKG